VIVENFLEATNHDHLGKLITYTAVVEGSYAVLVARTFRPEHRSAPSWLNEITASDAGFFGIEVHAVRIGNSAPAVRLDVVVEQDDWRRQARETVTGRRSDGRGLLGERDGPGPDLDADVTHPLRLAQRDGDCGRGDLRRVGAVGARRRGASRRVPSTYGRPPPSGRSDRLEPVVRCGQDWRREPTLSAKSAGTVDGSQSAAKSVSGVACRPTGG
jgi:hypothetical protein